MPAPTYDLHALCHPRTIAVIMASPLQDEVGYTVLHNLIQAGYPGTLIPVHPHTDTILDLSATTTINELPQGLDLAVVTLPLPETVAALEQLAQVGTKAVILMAGCNMAHITREQWEDEVIALCAKHHIALVGPDSLGMINTHVRINASRIEGQFLSGNIALISSSADLHAAMINRAKAEGIGFSKSLCLGSTSLPLMKHILAYLDHDPATRVVLTHEASYPCPKTFLAAAASISSHKPVIMLTSAHSRVDRDSSSPVSNMTPSHHLWATTVDQNGIIRTPCISTLFNLAQAFACQPLPKGPNLAVVTNAGGPGIMATDACERSPLHMASLSPSTVRKLKKVLPPYASLYNPIDMAGDARAQTLRQTLDILINDEHLHAILVLIGPTATAMEEQIPLAQATIHAVSATDKPVIPCFFGSHQLAQGRAILHKAETPCLTFPEAAVTQLATMYSYHQWRHPIRPLSG